MRAAPGVLTTAIALGAVAVVLLGLSMACAPPGSGKPTGPLRILEQPLGEAEASAEGQPSLPRCLLAFLPGIGDEPEEYARHGFVERLRAARVDADVRLVDAHFGYYRERSLVERLTTDVLEPAEAAGYEQTWLVGISLGGLGSLALTAADPERVDGLVLLAPYLGDGATIARVEASDWPAPGAIGAEPPFDGVWRWLAERGEQERPVPLVLAFGEADRYRRGHQLMRRALGERDVLIGAGGHYWAVWEELWGAIVASGRLQRACGVRRSAPAAGAAEAEEEAQTEEQG